ncbi:hypothetical protein ElyMa_005998500 [Elysia marginata]|uniref:Uncharacterized protein n=1 Tax=Elysia marginata TaxID=1093978 RepID=A0AAV4GI80_9GAST|nr:hypothetical protein ElyMa_005998500 [Elysia marginata]
MRKTKMKGIVLKQKQISNYNVFECPRVVNTRKEHPLLIYVFFYGRLSSMVMLASYRRPAWVLILPGSDGKKGNYAQGHLDNSGSTSDTISGSLWDIMIWPG